jgi:ribosomal protein S18 acetylase RimI-like enzyme
MTARFQIQQLLDHDRSTFSSGVEPLDQYFRHHASQDVKRKLSVCYVATEQTTGRIAVTTRYLRLRSRWRTYRSLYNASSPATRAFPQRGFGRLAVDRAFQGQGLGAALLSDALARVVASSMDVFAALVDAKDEKAMRFYEHHGFMRLGSAAHSLFLPLASAKV